VVSTGTKFVEYDLGNLQRGATVVVTLNTGANVRLMNSSNLRAYKNGRQHRYHGGLVKRSPFRIPVPSNGHWYVTVDLMGLRASSVRSSVAVEPPPLPTAQVTAEMWNTERARAELGASSIRSASRIILRLGVSAVAREPGRSGMNLYDAEQIRRAIASRPGRGRAASGDRALPG
jgi:Domain of unknown function (DUF1883)